MKQPAIPHLASTVVLARPSLNGGFEILMNRRPEKMDTYAGVHVFPGGRVEKSDWSAEMIHLTCGLTPTVAQEKLATELQPELCLGHWVAAVRELFEEVGIHFFVPQSGAMGNSIAMGTILPHFSHRSSFAVILPRWLIFIIASLPNTMRSDLIHVFISRHCRPTKFRSMPQRRCRKVSGFLPRKRLIDRKAIIFQ